MDRLGVAPDRITVNAQISRAVKEGRLDEAIGTFERLLDGVRIAHEGPIAFVPLVDLHCTVYTLILVLYETILRSRFLCV